MYNKIKLPYNGSFNIHLHKGVVMGNKKTCCFAGHSDVWDGTLEEKIKKVAEDLIINYHVKEFLVGNYGRFDGLAATVIRKLQKTHTNIKLNLIIPYLTKNINEYKELYYKNFYCIVMADIPENTPKRFHITKANEYMVNHSDFLICYIQKNFGGAFTTYKYATRKNLHVINIAEKSIEG